MTISKADIRLLELLAQRLERLSVDSKWAHRASGLRGQILRILDHLEAGNQAEDPRAKALIEAGFYVLRQAAREIRWRNLVD